jgi:hypothetical protein
MRPVSSSALGRRLVEGRLVVLLERVILHRRVVKDLERLGRRAEACGLQPAGETAGPVLAIHAVGGALHRLDKRPIRALLGGLLVDGQLGQRKRLEPLVGDGPAAQDRAAVGARSQAVLGPLQRLQPARELPGDRLVGLLQGPPVGAVGEVLGNLVGGSDTVVVGVHRRQESLQPLALLAKEGMRPLLVHLLHQPPVVSSTGPWDRRTDKRPVTDGPMIGPDPVVASWSLAPRGSPGRRDRNPRRDSAAKPGGREESLEIPTPFTTAPKST